MEAAARNSGTRAAYQIDLHDGNVLDCYATANRIRPTCFASMANSANGPTMDASLAREKNDESKNASGMHALKLPDFK